MSDRIENPRVGGSIPSLGTSNSEQLADRTSGDTVSSDPSKSAAIQAEPEKPNHICSTAAHEAWCAPLTEPVLGCQCSCQLVFADFMLARMGLRRAL
jgi:hypothetical protein